MIILSAFFAYTAVFALVMVLSELQSGVPYEVQEFAIMIGRWLIVFMIGYLAFLFFKKGIRLLKSKGPQNL